MSHLRIKQAIAIVLVLGFPFALVAPKHQEKGAIAARAYQSYPIPRLTQ